MSKYLDFFDECYYINRAERQDREELFIKRAFEVGILPKRQEAVIPSAEYVKPLYDGHEDNTRMEKISCTLSHQSIVSYAKENSLKNVLIFEDDCVFLEGFKEKLQLVVNDLKGCEWDLLYLGGEPNNYLHEVTENLYMMKYDGGIYANHAYAVNSTFYDKFLCVEANKVAVIDIFLINMGSQYRKIYASSELLAVQDYTYSDLWHYMTNSQNLMINGWEKYIRNGIKLN
jgi:GR25 family glycosyltransferase involved in LPS biosynthesis